MKRLKASDAPRVPGSVVTYFCASLLQAFEALATGDFEDASGELQQAVLALQLLLYRGTGWDLPLWGCRAKVEEFRRRETVWRLLFARRGLRFDPAFLKEGSNFRRVTKVRCALCAAGAQVSLADAALESVRMRRAAGETY